MIKIPSHLLLFGIAVIIFTIVGILLMPTCYTHYDPGPLLCGEDSGLDLIYTLEQAICVQKRNPTEVCSSAWDDIQAYIANMK